MLQIKQMIKIDKQIPTAGPLTATQGPVAVGVVGASGVVFVFGMVT